MFPVTPVNKIPRNTRQLAGFKYSSLHRMNRRRFLGATATIFSPPWLAASTTLVCRKPYVQRVRRTGATIAWATAEPGTATVKIFAPDGMSRSIPAVSACFKSGEGGASAEFYRHSAAIESLEPATEYIYTIHLDGRDLSPAGE